MYRRLNHKTMWHKYSMFLWKYQKKTLEGGLEPPTLWLTATRSSQLSYSSFSWNSPCFLTYLTLVSSLLRLHHPLACWHYLPQWSMELNILRNIRVEEILTVNIDRTRSSALNFWSIHLKDKEGRVTHVTQKRGCVQFCIWSPQSLIFFPQSPRMFLEFRFQFI